VGNPVASVFVLEHSWRPAQPRTTIMTMSLIGAMFVDGVFVPEQRDVSAA
jgi:hypothetical protein